MNSLAMYAVLSVLVGLALIPVGALLALVPFSIWGALGKALLGRGGADDSEAITLLHPYAKPDEHGFFREEELNPPLTQQNKAA